MSYEMRKLGADRYLVWDLLRETDPYYLNHHLFDTDLTVVEADRERRRAAGAPVPSSVAYALWAYGHTLGEFPALNSYLRLWPLTRLAVYHGVDIALTIEREWEGAPVILLGLLREAQRLSVDEVQVFLRHRKEAPLESLEEFAIYRRLRRVPAFCRWPLFQWVCKPFPGLMRNLVGTTAFTSVGKFGTTLTTPLSPRTVTLSLGHVERRPRAVPGAGPEPAGVEVRPSVWLTVTYDHRVADGAEIGRFGDRIRRRLETLA